MILFDRLVLGLCGWWFLLHVGGAVHYGRVLVCHYTRALVRYLRRRRNRITFRIVGAPYSGAPGLGK